MTWRYAVVRKHNAQAKPPVYYELHEVYFNDRGKPWTRTVDSIAYGDTPEELISVLEMMLIDAQNCEVIDDEDIREENEDEEW